MAANVGSVDRAIRLILGVALVVAPLINLFGAGESSVVAYAMIAVGGIFALTAVFGFCPIYCLLGINTKS